MHYSITDVLNTICVLEGFRVCVCVKISFFKYTMSYTIYSTDLCFFYLEKTFTNIL
jgi:hypothetical protein